MIKIIDAVKQIYHKTPKSAQFIYWPLKFIDKRIHKLRYDLWLLKGEEAESKEEITIIYAGVAGWIQNKNYLIKLLMNNPHREMYLGRTWLWKVSKKVKEMSHDCSLMIIEAHRGFRRFYENESSFYVPCWIGGEVDISFEAISEIKGSLRKNKTLSNDLRKIRKYKLDFEVTNDLSHFHVFYYEMYLPFILDSHDDCAVINDYDFMKREFMNCDLLLIKSGEEYIAGTMISYSKKGPRLWFVGVKDSNKKYLHGGAIAATYYYGIKYLKEKGYRKMNIGLTRAFLKDGVLHYKKKWGLTIVDAVKYGFVMKPLTDSVAVKAVLRNNPFIAVDEKERFNGTIFMNPKQSVNGIDFEKIYNDYHVPGISQLFIYFDGNGDGEMLPVVPSELRDTIKIYSTEDFFGRISGGVQ